MLMESEDVSRRGDGHEDCIKPATRWNLVPYFAAKWLRQSSSIWSVRI